MAQENVQPLTKDPELQIVMIGKTKVGKSATGNTILGRKAFRSFITNSSVTQECQIEKIELEGQNLAVVDTPGLFGSTTSDSSDEESPETVVEKIKQCMLLASPGPVVFLVVLQPGRFTEPEQQSVKIIQSSFGKEAAHYTMALFTRGDDLKKEGRSIEELIGADPALRDFIRECCGGYHVFDNGDADLPQVTELLKKINGIVHRNGGSNGELAPEGEGVPKKENHRRKARKEAEGGKILMKACLKGAIAGVCFMVLVDRRIIKSSPMELLKEAVEIGVIGAVANAASNGVCALIWGS
uniref:GTPase IMAP family member 7-like n=1 Tax=Semicossyphus pulcher TaxID=241346 RepID=UPI0037E8B3C8